MRIPPLTTTRADLHGRVCTGTCSRYLSWDSYRIDNKAITGHRARCKDCMRAETKSVHGDGLSACFQCQREVEPYEHLSQSVLCGECKRLDDEVYGYPNKVFYVLDDPTDTYTHGHFTKTDFQWSLKGKTWPAGMVIEEWEGYKYKGTFMVAGYSLLRVTRPPQGDGFWLLPDNQRSPTQRSMRAGKREMFRSAGLSNKTHMPPLPKPMPNA